MIDVSASDASDASEPVHDGRVLDRVADATDGGFRIETVTPDRPDGVDRVVASAIPREAFAPAVASTPGIRRRP